MVMSKQPDGMRRVKRAAGADGKTSEYTIYFTPDGGAETEVGYSRRVIKGSVSKWEGYLRTGEGTYQVFPEEYKDHNALMTDLRDRYLGSPLASQVPAEAPAAPAETAPKAAKTTKAKASKSTKVKTATAEAPAAEPEPVVPVQAPPVVVVVPGQAPAHLHAGGHDVVIPPASAEAQAAVAAADEEPPLAPAESVEAVVAEAVAEVAEPDGSTEVVVAVETESGDVAVAEATVPGDLQPDGTIQPLPAAVFSGDPLADPLADPLSPAFMPQG